MLSRTKRRSGYRRGPEPRVRRGFITVAVAALVLVASGAVVACSDNLGDPLASGQESTVRNTKGVTPSTVGALHNEFLDFAFPKVLAVASGRDQKKICQAITRAMREFVVKRQLPVDPASIGDDVAGPGCGTPPFRGGPRRSLAGDGTPAPELIPLVEAMGIAIGEGRSIGELAALFDQSVAYARAHFPAEEAEVVAHAASVGLSSVEYWDANYATQEQQIRQEMGIEAYSRIEAPPRSRSINRARGLEDFSLLTPPTVPSDNWLTEQSWYPKARRVALRDLGGAVDGAIKGIFGGWQGAGAGALVAGASASASAVFAVATQ